MAEHLSDFDHHLIGNGQHLHLYEKLGAHPGERDGEAGTWFTVWAPNARRVCVVGDFNDWDSAVHPMAPAGGAGLHQRFIPGIGVGALYKYSVEGADGQHVLKCDPVGFAMEQRPANASVVAKLDGFEWHDDAWVAARADAPWEQPLNIYEVHPGSWKRIIEDDGTQRMLSWGELAQELVPYVVDMGYTHIELMGVAEHPLDASWGYQVVGYYAPTSRHGGPHDFMAFVDACHCAGIGVLLDWVPSHFPRDAHGLARFDGTALYEYADPRVGEHREWGTKVFDYGHPQVRNFLIANALYWLDRFHVDGLRVDAVASMLYLDYNRNEGEWVRNRYGGHENLEAISFLKELNETVRREYPQAIVIAEESTAFPGVTHGADRGGLGFRFKWNMGWMNDTLRYMALDPVHRAANSQLITFSIVYAYSENYLLPLSHDEFVHGKGSLVGRMQGDEFWRLAQVRLYLGWQMGHPGKQLLFMGSEFGQYREWSEARSLDWHLLDAPDHRALQEYVRELNHLYLNAAACWSGDTAPEGFRWLAVDDHARSVYAFARFATAVQSGDQSRAGDARSADQQPYVFVFNFTPVQRHDYVLEVPAEGNYDVVLDSDDTAFFGSGQREGPDRLSTGAPAPGAGWAHDIAGAPQKEGTQAMDGGEANGGHPPGVTPTPTLTLSLPPLCVLVLRHVSAD